MLVGKVESTGNNVGGLVGYMHSYNRTNSTYTQNNYDIIQNSFATGEVIGASNIGALIGNINRQCTYNHTNQKTNIQITNSYAVGKITNSGEAGGLIGQSLSTYNGSTVVTNSYWTLETTLKDDSKEGIRRNIQSMLYSSGYVSWDFSNIWTIEKGQTLAYLKNVQKPESVKKENLSYQAFEILGGGTQQDPYIIKTPIQLQKVNENLEAYYRLGDNIDLSGLQWISIGSEKYSFSGQIDGNGYTISNLSIDKDENNIGLLGYNVGTIKNIKLNNCNVKGKNNVGGLVRI